ncbi:hypothetical protein CKY17_10980, partial [Enterococcus faecium]
MKSERKFEQSLEDYESLSKTELLYCHFRIRFTYVGAMSPCIGNWNRNEAVKFFQNLKRRNTNALHSCIRCFNGT